MMREPKRGAFSPTMLDALQRAATHGCKLVRLPGGYWTFDGAIIQPHNGSPEWWVSRGTVDALVTRGAMVYSEWKEGRNGKFPITATIIQRGDDE